MQEFFVGEFCYLQRAETTDCYEFIDFQEHAVLYCQISLCVLASEMSKDVVYNFKLS